MNKILLLPLLILSIICLASCTEPKQLVYQDAKNFRIGKLSFNESEVGMDLQFFNPNNFAMTLKDANIDVYINNSFIGKAALSSAFNVPAKDTFLMPVSLNADLTNIFQNALQILFNKEVEVKLDGTVTGGRGVFFTIPIKYQGKEKLNVF